jgi:multidrug efflux pump subunit AcrA (membrane-fusion protein)
MSKLNERPWLNLVLGLLCIGAIVVAYTTVGQASQGSAQSRTAVVQKGVVQSTVSGSGNIQAASQLNLGFKTSGTVTHIYVTQGQHVTKGQLLAALNPQSAEVALEQAKASLQSAEANLAKEEENEGETSSEQTSGGASTGGTSAGTSSSSSSSSSGVSSATRSANLASAKAAVKSDALTVQSDEQAVQDTKLYAPENGTIVTLSGEVGEAVTATGTTKASATSSSSSSSSSTGATGSASSQSGSAGSSSSSGSSSSFAVLSNLSSMRLVVPLSESEIGNVRAGQTATVTIEALSGRKVAAHVLSVDTLSTSNSGVVSYDVTFQLDQLESGLKPGMSATAEVVVKQAEGLNVPTTAISAGSVTVVRNGKHVSQSVTTGLAGDSSTIILTGLNAGEEIVLPSTAGSTTSASKAGAGSRVGGRLGGGGLGGGLGGGGAFPGGARPGG